MPMMKRNAIRAKTFGSQTMVVENTPKIINTIM